MSSARYWGPVFGAFLTACAAQGPVLREGGRAAEQEASWEQDCPEETSLVFSCGPGVCALYRAENVASGRAVLTRGAAVFTPPGAGSAMRWWGSAQEPLRDREPVFIIPWNQPPRVEQLSAYFRELAEEMARCAHEKHHIFSQAFKAWFAQMDINVHDFTILILVEDHRRIHRGANGGPWNEAWDEFIKAHPKGAQKEEIFRYAGELLFRFQVLGPLMTYYGGRAVPPCAAADTR